jgi:hypothetical protein
MIANTGGCFCNIFCKDDALLDGRSLPSIFCLADFVFGFGPDRLADERAELDSVGRFDCFVAIFRWKICWMMYLAGVQVGEGLSSEICFNQIDKMCHPFAQVPGPTCH